MVEADQVSLADEVFFVEHDGHRLLAFLHRPRVAVGRPPVVLCHPYGEEKQFSYPVLVRVSSLLSLRGFPVVRLDCRGHGDSDGDLYQATVESLIADTGAAVQLARDKFESDLVVLLGLRFGATVAVLVAEQIAPVNQLILWSPIIEGREYVEELTRKRLFAAMLRGEANFSPADVKRILARAGHVEIEGDFYSQKFFDEVAEISLAQQVSKFRGAVFLTALEDRRGNYSSYEALADAYQANGAGCEFRIVESRPFWDKSSMYKLRLPETLFEQTLQWLNSHWQKK